MCLGNEATGHLKFEQKRFYAWEEDKRAQSEEKRSLINFERNLQKDYMKRFYSWVNLHPKRLSRSRAYINGMNASI
uniref:Transposase n=1 Tax=Acrobeloides nanus TaxID=290746 RepID=A0A914DA99_9BILA